MLWAIDVGNTQTVVGIYSDGKWLAHWRLNTESETTEDELAAKLKVLCELKGVPFRADALIVASVVPSFNLSWKYFATKWLSVEAQFLTSGAQVGIPVLYDPSHAVGADRIANTLAGLAAGNPPLIVVDFGTATTIDVISARSEYLGGIILPGLAVSLSSLTSKTAKLPQIELQAPESVIGRTTITALQSGIVLGHAGAIDALVARTQNELGQKAWVIATGGLGGTFLGLCGCIEEYHPNLTLDGLRIAFEKISRNQNGN